MESNVITVGTAIGPRVVDHLFAQVFVDRTLVSAVRFRGGLVGIVTSGDRIPDLWPTSPVAAAFIGAASEIKDLFLSRESNSLYHHIRVVGIRDGRKFTAALYFGMWFSIWPKQRREDEVRWQ